MKKKPAKNSLSHFPNHPAFFNEFDGNVVNGDFFRSVKSAYDNARHELETKQIKQKEAKNDTI